MGFTENTRLREIYNAEHLKPIRDSLISGGGILCGKQLPDAGTGSAAESHMVCGGYALWSAAAGSALYGLLRI